MNIVNYIQRQQVNPIELSVFDKATNTLQQGHKEAVKAASDLELAIAKLDLNEKEDGFRAAKLNQIKETIRNNTIYGNSYGALSKIIESQGSILGGADMMGRLKAQAEYKQYQKTLDARQDISQDTKDRFKEMNPYHYEDKIDKKTGEIIGGTEWKPNSSPVEGVDMAKVASMALQLAAKEHGGSNKTTWLDANGNQTDDYSKSVTGAVFNVVTQQWDRLSPEKIRQGIKAAMGLIKGAKDSSMQDYETAIWKYNKKRKEDKNYRGTDDIIDKNGHIRSYDDYIDHMFTPMVEAAKYNNITTSTEYKNGLEAQKKWEAEQQALIAAANGGASGVDPQSGQPDLGANVSSGNQGTITVETNPYQDIKSNELRSNAYLLNTLRNLAKGKSEFNWLNQANSYYDVMTHYGKNGSIDGPGTAMNKLLQELRSKGIAVDAVTATALRNNASGYYNYNRQRTNMDKGLNADDRAILASSVALSTDTFKKGRSKSEDSLVDTLNELNTKTDSAVVTIYKEMINKLNTIKPDYLNDLRKQGFNVVKDGDNYKITIQKKDYSKAARVMGEIQRANDDTSAWNNPFKALLSAFQGSEGAHFGIDYYKNGKSTTVYGGSPLAALGYDYNKIADNYNDLATNRISAVSSKSTISVQNTGKTTFTEQQLADAYNRGEIKATDYNAKVQIATQAIEKHLSGGDLQSGLIYTDDGNGHYDKSDDPQAAGAFINYAMKNMRSAVTINAGEIPLGTRNNGRLMPTTGYFISISVPSDKKFGNFSGGNTYKFYYGKGFIEGKNVYNPSTNTYSMARQSINISSSQSRPISDMITDTSYIGEASINPVSDGTYICRFGTYKKNVSPYEAEQFAQACYFLDQTHDLGKGAIINAQQINPQKFANEYNNIVSKISNAVGADPHVIGTLVMNYLNTAQ